MPYAVALVCDEAHIRSLECIDLFQMVKSYLHAKKIKVEAQQFYFYPVFPGERTAITTFIFRLCFKSPAVVHLCTGALVFTLCQMSLGSLSYKSYVPVGGQPFSGLVQLV